MILCSNTVRSNKKFHEAMADISAAGFTDIDLLAIHTWAHINPADLVKDYDNILVCVEAVLKKENLTLRALNVGLNNHLYDRRVESIKSNLNELDAICRMMNYFSVNVAALQPMGKDPSRSLDESLKDCIKSLSEYMECAGKYGVTFGLELHANSPFETIDAMKYLFSELPDIRVIYDPTHIICMGYSLRECEFIMDRVCHVHIRNASKGNFQKRIDEGEADFTWIINTLYQKGYRGDFSIESLDNDEYDALKEAIEYKNMLENLCSRILSK